MIKGLSEKRRFPRLGKIRLGEKAISEKTGKEYPKAIDHFIIDAEDPKVQKMADELIGKESKELDIIFVSEDIEINFSQWYKKYRQSVGLACRGDGEKAAFVNDKGDLVEKECPCEELEAGTCRQVATLQFMIPRLPACGCFVIDTGSYNSIVNINSALELTRAIFGKISFIPFRLTLRPQECQVEGRKKNIFVLNLQAVGDLKAGFELLGAKGHSGLDSEPKVIASLNQPTSAEIPQEQPETPITSVQKDLIHAIMSEKNISDGQIRARALVMFKKEKMEMLSRQEADRLITFYRNQ